MVDFPPRTDIDYKAAEPAGPFTTAVLGFYDATLQLPGAVSETTLTIATGSITPTAAAHIVDTELQAAADDLANIVQTNHPDGRLLAIRCADAARVVTVKHGAAGAGQILLADGTDFILNDTTKRLCLRRVGTTWVEELRSFGADKAAARADHGLVIGTNVLAPNGNGSALTGIAKGATTAEKSQIAQNSFLIYAQNALAGSNTANGWVDVFIDQTGIDTAGSTNLTYDAVNHLYGNGGVLSITQQYTDTTAPNAQNAQVVAAQSFSVTTTGLISKARWYTYSDMAATTFDWTIETDNAGAPSGTLVNVNMTVAQAGPGASSWQDIIFPGAWTPAAGNTYWLTARNNAGGNLPANMWRSNQSAGTYASGKMYAPANGSLPNGDFLFGVYQQSATLNMTLISNATPALSTPTSTRIFLWEEDVAVVALNADLKAYASRDGGTTWTQILLAKSASLATGQLLTGAVDISAQPTGTSMQYKIETLNTKKLKMRGAQLYWS